MDEWYFDDDGRYALFSSVNLHPELFDGSMTSFDSISCSSIPSLITYHEVADFLELGDSNIIEQQSYQQASGFLGYDMDIQTNETYQHQQFAPSSDDSAITQAMVAVISSSLSSSSSSSSSPILYQLPQQVQAQDQSNADSKFGAFRPYNASPNAPDLELKETSLSQKMIKKSFSMLRRIDSTREQGQTNETRSMQGRTEESLSTNSTQTQHLISERKRREKLNDSFQTLRSLLPPGSKRDKASVLTNTKNYLSKLKAHISKLEEENAMLEMHLLAADDDSEDANSSNERVNVESIKGVQSKYGLLQQIELKISRRVVCDMIEFVLHVLECLKGIRLASLMSFDVKTRSHRLDLFVQATLTLQIKDSDWDEKWFTETMGGAVDGAMRTL